MKQKNKNIRSLLIFSILVILITSMGYLFFYKEETSKPKRETVVVGLKVYQENISDKIEALGTALSNESISITSNATETIKEINFVDGQEIKKGETIVILEQNAEIAKISAIKARIIEGERELKRVENLLSKKAATRREFDERNTTLLVIREELKETQAQIDERTLKAPFDGVLGIRRLSVGALVQPGTVITTLDDTSIIKLDFTIPAIYLSQLENGLPVFAQSDSIGDKIYEGKVSSINTRVDPVTRSVLVRAKIDNEDNKIKPGILMKVTLLEKDRDAIVVPEESIIQRGDKHFVYLINNQIVKQKEIQIGVRQAGIVEVVDGLEIGDEIVVRGMGEVRDGEEVKVKDVWNKIQDSQFNDSEL